MIPQDLLAILRCPHCVSSIHRPGGDPGRLVLVKDVWLVCQEPDCGRKYPIHDEIPNMRVEEGEKWRQTAVDTLPVPPPASK